jgi:fluoride exporter
MQTAWSFAAVFLGGGIGSALRYGVGRASVALVGPSYPAGTLAVNLIGCFFMGALAGWLAHRDWGVDHATKLLLATGLLGGFTTFSAFALDAVTLWQRGQSAAAAIYVFVSVVGSVAGLLIGLQLSRTLLG